MSTVPPLWVGAWRQHKFRFAAVERLFKYRIQKQFQRTRSKLNTALKLLDYTGYCGAHSSIHFAQLKDNFPGKQPGEDQAIAAEAQELIAKQNSCHRFIHFGETTHTVI